MTDAEKALWSKLRDRQLDGFKFRRQHPFGPFVLDFFCEPEKLVVELDGGQHADDPASDARRTRWLEREGCRLIRFWNHEVLQNMDGVLEAIAMALAGNLHPASLRDATPKSPLPGERVG